MCIHKGVFNIGTESKTASLDRSGHCPACGSTSLATAFTGDEWCRFAATTTDNRARFAAAMAADPDLAFNRFLRCQGCGTLFTDRVPSDVTLGQFYHQYCGNPGYLAKIPKKLRRENKRIVLFKRLVRERRFLDVGCNVGCAVEAARRNGFTATGLELSAEAIESARHHFPQNEFVVGTLEALTPERRFDLVFCSEVLEHVPNVEPFVKQLADKVAPGGVLFLTTPDSGHRQARRHAMRWDTLRPPEHLTLFTRDGVRAALAPYFRRVMILPNQKPGIKALAFKAKP